MVTSGTRRWHPVYERCSGWGPAGDHHDCPYPLRPHFRDGRCAPCYECQRLYNKPKDLFVSINDTGLGWGDTPMVGAVATTPNSAGPARAWHPEHARCLGWGPEDKPNACKTPGAPHKAGGRCRHCAGAQQRYDEDQRILQHQRESSPEPAPVKRWSRNHDACVGWDDRNGLRHPCSTAHAPHASHGRCINCAQKQVREAEIAAAATPAPQPAADLAVAARATVGIAQPAAPAFEVFTQVGPIKENGPALTVRLDGSVTINAAAYELLGRPAFVELLYAREGRMLGLRASPSVPHARTIRRDKDKKRIFVSARPLLKFYALEQARAVPASTRQYGDVLAVQLTTDRARG